MSILGGTGRWKVVVDGSERVQQGASSKYGMKVGKRVMRVHWMVQEGRNGALGC